MKQKQLYPLVRQKFAELINDYVQVPDLEQYIVAPGLEDNSGLLGSLLLAADAE